jgi:hypothetical protein
MGRMHAIIVDYDDVMAKVTIFYNDVLVIDVFTILVFDYEVLHEVRFQFLFFVCLFTFREPITYVAFLP